MSYLTFDTNTKSNPSGDLYLQMCNIKIIIPTFARLACPGVIFPASYSLHNLHPIRDIACMLPSMRASFSWLIWYDANGAPNCFLSWRYLKNFHFSEHIVINLDKPSYISQVFYYLVFKKRAPLTHVINSHAYTDRLPCNYNSSHCKHLQHYNIYCTYVRHNLDQTHARVNLHVTFIIFILTLPIKLFSLSMIALHFFI